MPDGPSPITGPLSNSNWQYSTYKYPSTSPLSSPFHPRHSTRYTTSKTLHGAQNIHHIPGPSETSHSPQALPNHAPNPPDNDPLVSPGSILTSSPPHQTQLASAEMLAAMRCALGGGGHAGGQVMAVQMELQQLKAAPILNPHFGMVMKYLDCLNRYMDAIVMTQGSAGVKMWLLEVQVFIRQLQKRIFQRMPLLPQERQGVLSFAAYWRQMVGPPYAMARPEAQLVLITLTEFAQR